jgi:hypothetical protein
MIHVFLTFLLLFAPLPVLIAVGRVRIRVRRRRLGVSEEPVEVKPFEPKPEPTPGWWLRRFSLPERTYLRQQAGTAKAGFYVVAWCFFALASSSLLPGDLDRFVGWPAGSPQLIWFDYLQGAFVENMLGLVMAVGTAMAAGYGLIPGLGMSAMHRTRPLTLRLLYWGRVGPALATLLAGYAVGIALSLLLLLALHGPVWRHLNVNGQGLALTLIEMRRIAWMLRVSPAKLVLAAATSMSMVFAALVAFVHLPLGKARLPKWTGWVLGLTVYESFSTFGPMVLPHVSNVLFLYGLTAKTPPPWIAALVPVCMTGVLLCCGQLLYRRSDV